MNTVHVVAHVILGNPKIKGNNILSVLKTRVEVSDRMKNAAETQPTGESFSNFVNILLVDTARRRKRNKYTVEPC